MNSDTAQGNWQQLKGKIKQKWGKLTDDDLTRAEGDKDYLMGKLHEQYGLAKDRAKDELESLGYRDEEAEDSSVDLRSSSRSGAGRMEMSGADTRETGGAVNSTYDNNDRPESVDEDLKAGYSNAEGQSPRNKLEAASEERQGVDSPGASSGKDEPGRH